VLTGDTIYAMDGRERDTKFGSNRRAPKTLMGSPTNFKDPPLEKWFSYFSPFSSRI
jgi:hypothetical protein